MKGSGVEGGTAGGQDSSATMEALRSPVRREVVTIAVSSSGSGEGSLITSQSNGNSMNPHHNHQSTSSAMIPTNSHRQQPTNLNPGTGLSVPQSVESHSNSNSTIPALSRPQYPLHGNYNHIGHQNSQIVPVHSMIQTVFNPNLMGQVITGVSPSGASQMVLTPIHHSSQGAAEHLHVTSQAHPPSIQIIPTTTSGVTSMQHHQSHGGGGAEHQLQTMSVVGGEERGGDFDAGLCE